KTYDVALVAFGSRAYVAVPPTQNRALVQTALYDLHQGEGTALGDAIRIASRLGLGQRATDGTVPPTSVLLISDGARDGGRTSPAAAAQAAKRLHVPISTVLLGTSNGIVTAQLTGGYTERIRVPPSPQTLESVAALSGGEFFRARTPAALANVYRHLATRAGHRVENRELGDLLAEGALVLLLAGGAASAFWFRRVP
ncbi:MAG: vWA domain-containing protein, partial [Gaiellaceae bacterium]